MKKLTISDLKSRIAAIDIQDLRKIVFQVASWMLAEQDGTIPEEKRITEILSDYNIRPEAAPKVTKVPTCPDCGNTDPDTIRYVEHIESWRRCLKFTRSGILQVDGYYETGDGYDDGHDPYWECHVWEYKRGNECLKTWPVTDEEYKRIDWI